MLSQEQIEKIVADVVKEMHIEDKPCEKVQGGCFFDDMNDCVAAAVAAQKAFIKLGTEKRRTIVEAIRQAARDNVEVLAKAAYEETKYGSVAHKTAKCLLAANKTPGVEDLEIRTFTGDDGLTLVFPAPFGIVGSITPSTNPIATVVNNAISMTAGGNVVVFSVHPAAKKCSAMAIQFLNDAAVKAGAPAPLLYAVKEPTIEQSQKLMEHPAVRILAVNGGEGIVRTAMKTGKKVVAAGPGNPPVIVDETADIEKAAKSIVDGASFENNIPCIAEKETFVVESVGNALVAAMIRAGAQLINVKETQQLLDTVLIKKGDKYTIHRDYVGRDAAYLLKSAGITVQGEPRLVVAITDKYHPFVTTEMLMPVMPVVYVKNVDEAIDCAVEAEQGNHHSAHMHSTNVDNLSRAAAALDTTIFVKNGPSYAGIGFGGEGFCTFTIATPTGEGLTSARTFTRSRRCTMRGSFNML